MGLFKKVDDTKKQVTKVLKKKVKDAIGIEPPDPIEPSDFLSIFSKKKDKPVDKQKSDVLEFLKGKKKE